MKKVPVGILGATGMVGQRFIQLLDDHPWFEVAAVAASDRSAGRRYSDACRWLLPGAVPSKVAGLPVRPLDPALDCELVFSALPSDVAGPVEESFADAGYAVCSNAASHRLDPDVPLLIPEVNWQHTALIGVQRRRRKGFIATGPNCSTAALTLALRPLHDAFGVRRVFVVTMQALSGAGYPGTASLDILGNVIPHIGGEEAKVEQEPLKLLGTLTGDGVAGASIILSAQCNRVPVRDGHTECVSIELETKTEQRDVVAALQNYEAPPGVIDLPSTPRRPVVVRTEPDRPQPARDRDAGCGMSVSVGRVRPCPLLDHKFVLLGHNTVRGAAGGSIHNAELLVKQRWLG
ncbi:MAG: aspartate-semialdehyde dehydrogenase [Acidobacteriota bacterium]